MTFKKIRFAARLVLFINFVFAPCVFSSDAEPPIIIYGDSQSNNNIHKKIIEDIRGTGAKYVFHTGDLVLDGNKEADWKAFKGITNEFLQNVSFYPALGNHDKGGQLYYENFPYLEEKRWYSIDALGIHFIILDSNTSIAQGSEQFKWLKSDLENSKGKYDFTVAIFHAPVFSSAFHQLLTHEEFRATVPKLFERYGVSIVFSGHVHAYERCSYRGTYYITTGGGGARLRPKKIKSSHCEVFVMSYNFCELTRENDTLKVRVLDENLKLLDQFLVKAKKISGN